MNEIENLSHLILTEFETCIFSFSIYPVRRKEYICFVVESKTKRYLLCGAYESKEYIRFIREIANRDASFKDFLFFMGSSHENAQLYRTRFLRKFEISDEKINELIDEISNMDWSKVKYDCLGFDGFTLTAYCPKKKQTAAF